MKLFLSWRILAVAAGLALAAPSGAVASAVPPHEDQEALFDRDLEAFVSGVVSQVSCGHSALSFRVISALDGAVWKMKMPPLPLDDAQRLRSFQLVEGATVSVSGWPSKDGANKLAVIRVMVNGQALKVR